MSAPISRWFPRRTRKETGDSYIWQKQGFKVEWASEPILCQAVVQFLEQNVFKGRTILQSAASNPDLGALYGLLFERFLHRVVTSVSTSSPYRSLENEIGLGSLEL